MHPPVAQTRASSHCRLRLQRTSQSAVARQVVCKLFPSGAQMIQSATAHVDMSTESRPFVVLDHWLLKMLLASISHTQTCAAEEGACKPTAMYLTSSSTCRLGGCQSLATFCPATSGQLARTPQGRERQAGFLWASWRNDWDLSWIVLALKKRGFKERDGGQTKCASVVSHAAAGEGGMLLDKLLLDGLQK